MRRDNSTEVKKRGCVNKRLRQGLCAILALVFLMEPLSLITFAEDIASESPVSSENEIITEIVDDDYGIIDGQTDSSADAETGNISEIPPVSSSYDDESSDDPKESEASDEDETASSVSDQVSSDTVPETGEDIGDVSEVVESSAEVSEEAVHEDASVHNDQDASSTGLISAEEIWANEFDEAGAAKLTDVGKTGKESGFGINIYYLYEENSHLMYKRDDFGIKYQLEFQSDEDLEAESVEIRIPAGFITYGENENTVPVYPSAVGVPEAVKDEDGNWIYTKSDDSDFNYYIESETGDLVFVNYAAVESESVNAIQVVYSNIKIAEITSDLEWSVVPAVKIALDGDEITLSSDDAEPIAGKAEYVLIDDSEEPADTKTEPELQEAEAETDNMPLLRSIKELTALPESEVGAVYVYDGPMRAASAKTWTYDLYYINQSNPHEVTKYDDFNLKYQMEFHNSVDIEQFDVQIRFPRSLIEYGHGSEERDTITPTLGMDIGIPAGTYNKATGEYTYSSARRSSFNYYYDEETDELVFFNYRKIPAGSDDAWQVLFKSFDVMNIEDGYSRDFVPDVKVTILGEVQTLEENETPHLKVNVDTRVNLNNAVKEAVNISGKSYGPGLYTPNQVASYVPNLSSVLIPGTEERLIDHFSDYVYVLWKIGINGSANQPYSVELLDASSKNGNYQPFGFIVGLSDSDIGATKAYDEEFRAEKFVIDEYSKQRSLDESLFVVCAYPRNEVRPNETVLDNYIRVTMTPYDGKDAPQYIYREAHWTYVDYEWHYSGDIIGINKFVYGSKGSAERYERISMPAWTTARKLLDGSRDMQTGSFTSTGTCRSFELTHEIDNSNGTIGEYIPGRYAKVTTVDDAVYAYPLDGSDAGSKYLLSKDDYYFSDITVRVRDSGWDVWEDKSSDALVPVTETTDLVPVSGLSDAEQWTLDRGMTVYAMFAKDENGNDSEEDVWEKVGYVEWNPSGRLEYKFTSDQEARQPWRIKFEHNAVDYVSYSDIDCDVIIRAGSPVFARFSDADHVELENLSGIMGERFWFDTTGGYFQDQKTDNYKEVGLLDLTWDLYHTVLMRDNSFVNLNPIQRDASAQKQARARNNPSSGRVELTYSMSAEEGYWVYDREVLDLLADSDLQTPDRKEVVFYDLLPAGVRFDPSVPISVSRDVGEYSGSSSNQVEVSFDPASDIIEDYNGTGRTRLAFHISYTGRDASAVRGSSSGYKWFTGYNLSFGAYLVYEDLILAQSQQNIVAYMPANNDQRPILGTDQQVSLDNGTVQTSDGFAEYYSDLAGTGDINQDGLYDTRNVLYAQASKLEDMAVAAPAGIQKYVRASSDPFGEYRKSAIVFPGEEYEYKLIVTNSSVSRMNNVVIFDRLENSINDRQVEEPGKFESRDWKGTFNGLILSDLTSRGADPVVYYNANRDAAVPPHGSDVDPYDILTTENGWIPASEWTDDLADVKAIAVDCRINDFTLQQQDDISFRIKMIAPDTYDETAVWAYNNPGFYSELIDLNTKATVWANSVKVKMVQADSLELMKTLSDNTPDSVKEEDFKFFLSWDDGESKSAYSYKEYLLYEKNAKGKWIKVEGMHATDSEGALYLNANQKAVFERTEAEHIVIEEESSLRFTPDEESLEGTIQNGVRTVNVLNQYHPILYFTKHVVGYSSPDRDAINLQSFRVKLTDSSGEPVANAQLYVVRRANLNGGEPIVIDASHKLYGELAQGTPTYTRTLTTDENGVFEIYPEETIAIPLDNAGMTYAVTELEECYAEDTEWICDAPRAEAKLSDSGSLLEITNKYRWKNLMITKTVQNAGSRDLSDYEFTFKVYEADPSDADKKGTLLKDFVWQVIDNRNSAFDESGWKQPNEDGSITAACAGKVIVVRKFKAGTKLVVEEILDDDTAKVFEAVTGQDSVLIPKFASAGYADIVNEYLLRDLRVEKYVISEDQSQISSRDFEFTLETCPADADDSHYAPAADAEYSVYLKNEQGEYAVVYEGKTDADGKFFLRHDTYALFTDLGAAGLKYRVREKIDEVFPPVLPMEDPDNEGYTEYITGELAANNSIEFINGDDSVFIFRKNWIGDDAISQQFIDQYSNYNDLSCGVTLDFKGVPVSVVSSRNTSLYSPNYPQSYYNFRIYSDDAYVVFKVDDSENAGYYDIPSIDYKLEETSYPYQFYRNYSSGYNQERPFDGPFTNYNGRWLMLNGMNMVSIEGTIGERREIILENHVQEISSYLQKRVTGKNVPAGSKLVWRIERYNGSAWEPASGIEFSLVSNSYAFLWDEYYRNYKYYQNRMGEPVSRMTGVTGEDGLISIVNDGEFLASSVTSVTDPFNEGNDRQYSNITGSYFYVFFDQKVQGGTVAEPKEGDLRAVEMESLSDKEWGTKTAYITSGLEQGFPGTWASSPMAGPNSIKGFVNSTNYSKLKVSKVVDVPTSQVFNFKLEKYADPISGSALVNAENVSYKVYDSETNEEISEGVTGSDGGFTLQGGQYAVFDVAPGATWRVTESDPLPYYLEKIEVGGKELPNGGNVADVGHLIDNSINMLRRDFFNGLTELMNEMHADSYYPPDLYIYPNYPTNRIKNIYFGKTSDYPSAISDTYVTMDNTYQGNIRGYAVPNSDNSELFDVYILSDDVMFTNYDSSYMFSSLYGLENIYFSNVDTSLTKRMNDMFSWCPYLATINGTSSWDTSSVTDMSFMFQNNNYCYLRQVDVSNWDVSNVKNMNGMFSGCYVLEQIDVSKWNTANVENMANMFAHCSQITSLDVSRWDTGKVKDMSGLFTSCYNLESLDVSGWNTSSVENMNGMFSYSSNLKNLNVSGFDTSNVKDMGFMFSGCYHLESLDVSRFNTAKVQNMSYMFNGCSNVKTLDVSSFITSNVQNMEDMFQGCQEIESLDISGWDTSKVTDMDYMFSYCRSLKSLDISHWNTSQVQSMRGMFNDCSSLTVLDLSGWNTSSVMNMESMFSNCDGLTSIDLSSWNTGAVQYIDSMFSDCDSLTSIDLSSWNTGAVQDMGSMFSGCDNLTSVNLSTWNVSSASYMGSMFSGCGKLQTVDITNFDLVNSNMSYYGISYMFNECRALTTIYCDYDWTPRFSSSNSPYRVFYHDYSLPGYVSENYDSSHCHPGTGGYFTEKA